MDSRFNGNVYQLCDIVRQTAFEVHSYFKHGYQEKIYRNSLVNRLRAQGILVQPEAPLSVHDFDGSVVGNFSCDLMIEGVLIAELKAVRVLCDEHVAQLLGYLRASRIEHGLLLNFGAPKFEIKKFALTPIAT